MYIYSARTCHPRTLDVCHIRIYTYTYLYIYVFIPLRIYTYVHILCENLSSENCVITRRPRPTGCLIFVRHFLHKSPIISGSFAERDVQLKAFYASWPPCTWCTNLRYIVPQARTCHYLIPPFHHSNNAAASTNLPLLLLEQTQQLSRCHCGTSSHCLWDP